MFRNFVITSTGVTRRSYKFERTTPLLLVEVHFAQLRIEPTGAATRAIN